MRFWTTIALILVLSAVGLTYEIAAGRVLAPFFGTSLVTWTTVIAVVLAGFALGSALGGLLAERPRRAALRGAALALVAAAVLMALSPLVLGSVYAAGARGTGGMILAVALAFFPASVLVTLPSPYLAKRAVEARPGREGSSLGLVLAAGSLGAIAGAILAGFVLLPLVGSAATFAGCGAAALGCLLVLRGADAGPEGDGDGPGAAASRAPIWPAVLALAAGLASGSACRFESGLSCLDVAPQGSAVHLYSDRIRQAGERTGSEDQPPMRRLVVPYTQWLWNRMDRDLEGAASVLFIGGGGYTLPAQWLAARPDGVAVVVEIDPLVTAVVQRPPALGRIVARARGPCRRRGRGRRGRDRRGRRGRAPPGNRPCRRAGVPERERPPLRRRRGGRLLLGVGARAPGHARGLRAPARNRRRTGLRQPARPSLRAARARGARDPPRALPARGGGRRSSGRHGAGEHGVGRLPRPARPAGRAPQRLRGRAHPARTGLHGRPGLDRASVGGGRGAVIIPASLHDPPGRASSARPPVAAPPASSDTDASKQHFTNAARPAMSSASPPAGS